MKRIAWFGVIALVVLGVYKLNVSLEKAGAENPVRAQAAPDGAWVVSPGEAQVTSTLQVHREGSGGTAEPASIKWLKNGNAIPGQTGPVLQPGNFVRGDEIGAEVVESPGAEPRRAATARIINTPPTVLSAAADLRSAAGSEVYLQVSSADADNDPVSLSYQWYCNGKSVPEATGATVSVSNFEMGDEVYALVTANDGHEASAAQRSDAIKIGSNAPDIVSTPPSTLEGGRRFVYQVQVRAPKPESIKYQLLDAPDGMTIDETGLIQWTMPALEETAHLYEIAIRVSDPTGGEAVQRFHLSASLQRGSNE